MNKIFLVLGLMFVVATILFSGCITTDTNTTNNDSTNNVIDNTNANGSNNISNDMTQPPAFPSD